jgi:diacylglycerol kinase (ATP)
MKNAFYIPTSFFKSLKIALKGLKMIVKNERNFRIQLVVAGLVVLTGLILGFSHYDWIATSFFITLVLVAEAFNSVIEAVCDTISLQYRDTIRYAKDVSAGAVLLSSLASLIGGTIIIYPYVMPVILDLLGKIGINF